MTGEGSPAFPLRSTDRLQQLLRNAERVEFEGASHGEDGAECGRRKRGDPQRFLTIPIGNGRVYCYCDVASRSSAERYEDFGELFSGFAEPAPTLIDSLGDERLVHRSTIEEVALDGWVRGRVVLIGDAAHATSPNMAEGAAMAFEDALVLAECLQRSDAVPAALATFEARRRPRTDWVRAQTHRRDRTRYLPTAVRNAVLRAFGTRIFRSNYRPLLEEA